MGLCKCRNITDLYCFVHKKAVCQACICPDHQVCVIGTYVEWLQDPDYEPPLCSICKDPVHEDNVLRLMCLHLFHPECIDVHASSFPPNTAQAGFTCPNCSRAIIPPANATSPLARLILEHVKNAPWLHPVEKIPSSETKAVGRGHHPTSENSSQEITIDIPGGEGIAPRKSIKTPKMPDIENNGSNSFDDDDDKYRKPHLSHLLDGLIPKEETAGKKQRSNAFRITPRKVLIIFALLSMLGVVFFLHRALSEAMP